MKNSLEQLQSKSQFLPLLLIAISAAIIFFAFLGNFSLFNPDEGLYAEPAREMLETGQYITTTLNYVVRFTKPPLVIWAMALAFKIFGISEFAARIFCATSGFLLTIITFLFANQYLNKRTAIFASCILLTSPLFIGVGRMAITDMPLSLFMTGSLFAFFHAWQQKQKRWLYIGYTLTACAIMTKGPVGLLLPSIILFSFFFLCDANKSTLKFLNIPLGALLMSIIALPWFVIEIYVTNGAYFQEFIMRENFARFTSVVDSHKGPWFYHIAAILGGLFPWSILLPQSLYKITKRLLSNLNIPKNINPLKKFQNAAYDFTVTDKALLLASLGSLITICFFSASVSKLLPYTLPAFPLLAIIIAFQWHTFIESKKQKSIFIYGLTISFIYFVAVFVSPFALKFLRDAPPTLITLIFWYASLMGTSTFIFTLVATRRSMILGSNLLFGMMILSGAIFLPLFLSVICDHWEGDIPKYAKSISKTQKPLIIYKLRKPGIPFYFGRKVIQINDTADLIQTTKNLGVCYLITKHKYLTDVANNGFRVLEERDNFALLSTTNK